MSKRQLTQAPHKWKTNIFNENNKYNASLVNIISFNELEEKYNLKFDTLVIDCEGAFYYILLDMSEILHNIRTIIIENDFKISFQKEYVINTFIKESFVNVYNQPLNDVTDFYQVWKRQC